MMKKNIVIIAGGEGSRIKKTLNTLPKILAPIGNKLLIDYQIEHISKFKNNNIHFCLGKGSEQILAHLNKTNLQFTYSIEETALGTYGALYNAREYLADNFFVLYGDIITNFNIDFGFTKFESFNSDFLVISRYTNHPEDSDLIETDRFNNVLNIYRSKNKNRIINPLGITALMYAKKSSIKEFDIIKADIVRDYLTTNINNFKIKHLKTDSYTRDIGTDKRYKDEVSKIKKNISRSNKLAFLDRDETLIENNEKNNIKHFKFKNGALNLIKFLQSENYTTVLITNQPGVAKGVCKIEDVENLHNYLQLQLIQKNLNPLNEIKYCPHHPDKGFKGENLKYKKKCQCRKPSHGMVSETLSDFNYQKNDIEMIFIGDTKNDYSLAKKFDSNFYLLSSKFTERKYFEEKNIKINNSLMSLIEDLKKNN